MLLPKEGTPCNLREKRILQTNLEVSLLLSPALIFKDVKDFYSSSQIAFNANSQTKFCSSKIPTITGCLLPLHGPLT